MYQTEQQQEEHLEPVQYPVHQHTDRVLVLSYSFKWKQRGTRIEHTAASHGYRVPRRRSDSMVISAAAGHSTQG